MAFSKAESWLHFLGQAEGQQGTGQDLTPLKLTLTLAHSHMA